MGNDFSLIIHELNGRGQNTDPQSMDYLNGLPKWITPESHLKGEKRLFEARHIIVLTIPYAFALETFHTCDPLVSLHNPNPNPNPNPSNSLRFYFRKPELILKLAHRMEKDANFPSCTLKAHNCPARKPDTRHQRSGEFDSVPRFYVTWRNSPKSSACPRFQSALRQKRVDASPSFIFVAPCKCWGVFTKRGNSTQLSIRLNHL